jgi:hypothetical protein
VQFNPFQPLIKFRMVTTLRGDLQRGVFNRFKPGTLQSMEKPS